MCFCLAALSCFVSVAVFALVVVSCSVAVVVFVVGCLWLWLSCCRCCLAVAFPVFALLLPASVRFSALLFSFSVLNLTSATRSYSCC